MLGCTEKIEYRAVVWGTIIMGLTGLLIWFKVDVTRFFHTRLSVFCCVRSQIGFNLARLIE